MNPPKDYYEPEKPKLVHKDDQFESAVAVTICLVSNKPRLVYHDDQWESAVAVTICLVLGLVIIIIIAVATSGIK